MITGLWRYANVCQICSIARNPSSDLSADGTVNRPVTKMCKMEEMYWLELLFTVEYVCFTNKFSSVVRYLWSKWVVNSPDWDVCRLVMLFYSTALVRTWSTHKLTHTVHSHVTDSVSVQPLLIICFIVLWKMKPVSFSTGDITVAETFCRMKSVILGAAGVS